MLGRFIDSKGEFPFSPLPHQIVVDIYMLPGGIYISTRTWWAKRSTWRLTLNLKPRLCYHQRIDNAMTHVPNFEN